MVWDIWKKMEAKPEDLSEVIADCEAFMNGRQTDQLAPVVAGILSWCYFKTDRVVDGVKLLTPLAQKRFNPMQMAGSDVARTWLSRFDIKIVKLALQVYYRKNLKYPETMQEGLDYAATARTKVVAPATDRWGKPWEYELVGFKTLEKVPKNQKYAISSKLLGTLDNLEEALELPYAEKINLVPIRMGSTTRNEESVYFNKADDKNATPTPILIKVGERRSGVMVGFVGSNVIALTDGNHWKLVPRPLR